MVQRESSDALLSICESLEGDEGREKLLVCVCKEGGTDMSVNYVMLVS